MKQFQLRKYYGRFAAVTWLLLSGVAVSRAEEPVRESAATNLNRTVESLVEEALANNPELKFYQGEITVAKAGRKTAARPVNPELTATIGHKRARDDGMTAEGLAWSASVMQPFEWPGRIGLRKAIANYDVELANLGYERFKIALAGRVRALAFGLFAAQEKADAATEVSERFTALREILVQRDPAGLTPLLETRVVEATELNARRKTSEMLLNREKALLELNQLRGVAPDQKLVIEETGLTFRPSTNREALLTLARTNNFELRVRAAELAQQGFLIDLAKNERYPAISVGPTISEERAGDREQIIGLGVTMPLPFWNRNKGNIDSATARQMQAEISFKVAERDLQRRTLEALLTYETKVREMARWRPDSVQHFKEAAEIADRHYRLGAVPISTYVELQKQYLEAVEGLLDTKREALDAALQLELFTGAPLSLLQVKRAEEKP